MGRVWLRGMLRCIFCPRWHMLCFSSHDWHILTPRQHWIGLVNTCWDKFCVPGDIREFWSKHVEMHFSHRSHGRGVPTHVMLHFVSSLSLDLVNASSDRFYVLPGKGWGWSTHVEMHFLSSLAYVMFVQHMLSSSLSPRLHGIGLVNTCRY
jgi:hypothetical protein